MKRAAPKTRAEIAKGLADNLPETMARLYAGLDAIERGEKRKGDDEFVLVHIDVIRVLLDALTG